MFDIFADKVTDINFILNAVWRRRLLLLILMVACGASAYVYSFYHQRYTARTTILIQDTRSLNPLLSEYSLTPGLAHSGPILQAFLHNRQLLTKVAELLGKVNEDMTEREQLKEILTLSKHLQMQILGRDLITMSYWDYTPDELAKTLNLITRLFIVNILYPRATSARDTEKFILERLEDLKNDMAQSTETIAKYNIPSVVNANPQARLAELLKYKLGELKSRYTDKHSRVKQFQHLVNKMESKATPEKSTSASAALDERDIQNEVKELQNKLVIKKRLYDGLLDRYEQLQLNRELVNFEASERIQIVEPAITPLKPSSQPPYVFLLAGMIGGLFIGAAIALFLEIVDTRIKSRSTIEKLSSGPIICRIPQL